MKKVSKKKYDVKTYEEFKPLFKERILKFFEAVWKIDLK